MLIYVVVCFPSNEIEYSKILILRIKNLQERLPADVLKLLIIFLIPPWLPLNRTRVPNAVIYARKTTFLFEEFNFCGRSLSRCCLEVELFSVIKLFYLIKDIGRR